MRKANYLTFLDQVVGLFKQGHRLSLPGLRVELSATSCKVPSTINDYVVLSPETVDFPSEVVDIQSVVESSLKTQNMFISSFFVKTEAREFIIVVSFNADIELSDLVTQTDQDILVIEPCIKECENFTNNELHQYILASSNRRWLRNADFELRLAAIVEERKRLAKDRAIEQGVAKRKLHQQGILVSVSKGPRVDWLKRNWEDVIALVAQVDVELAHSKLITQNEKIYNHFGKTANLIDVPNTKGILLPTRHSHKHLIALFCVEVDFSTFGTDVDIKTCARWFSTLFPFRFRKLLEKKIFEFSRAKCCSYPEPKCAVYIDGIVDFYSLLVTVGRGGVIVE